MAKHKRKHNNKKLRGKKPIGFINNPAVTKSELPSEKMPPYFSFHLIQKDYCVSKCDSKDKAALADQLRKLSQKNWAEIKQTHRHGLGCEKIEKTSLTPPIPPGLNKDDVTFLAFRFSGKKSMIGYRERNIFHIVWLDHDRTVYNHE